jgi:hypothetical protein
MQYVYSVCSVYLVYLGYFVCFVMPPSEAQAKGQRKKGKG